MSLQFLSQEIKTCFFTPAILALADGTIFQGRSIGSSGFTVAEIVFNTSMTGYQEILTDPSYSNQIVTLTFPHIGNTGINNKDIESDRIHVSGLVIRDCSSYVSNFRSTQSLPDYLAMHGIIAISNIDTRKLTRIIRDKGTQGACIFVGNENNIENAIRLAKGFSGISGKDLIKKISIQKPTSWKECTWKIENRFKKHSDTDTGNKLHIVVYDFGVKYNILRSLIDRNCRVTVVPAQTSAYEVLKLNPDGIFLSNGPGDPEPCKYAISAANIFLKLKLPIFGICLGHQIIGLAVGAKVVKMKTGHHGGNHPVQELPSKKVFITSQNHNFSIDANTLPPNTRVTHISLFDGSLQGFEFIDRPAFCFQGHPESSPGPHDIIVLFDKFIDLIYSKKKNGLCLSVQN